MDVFDTYYYDQDHLGNIRQVTDKSGKAVQTTDYYPFGMQLCDGITSSFDQKHKYNGQGSCQRVQTSSLSLPSAAEAQPKVKEFDTMHGLNTYDYGARQYNPVTARWDRMDPLCEKYYSVSPYVYCVNNPVKMVDPDGRDSGDFFKTLDEATKDFGLFYNDNSIRVNREFGSTAFVVKDNDGNLGFNYSIANEGNKDSVIRSSLLGKATIVASFHTHGAYDKNYSNNEFSGSRSSSGNLLSSKAKQNVRSVSDIGNSNRSKILSYVATPNGSLQKYDPATGKVSVVSNEMPSDANDPDRMNVISDKETNNISMKDKLEMQRNINEGILNALVK